MTRRFILTGAPGAGKTALIRYLETRGHDIIEEAATDIIALEQVQGSERPWEQPRFISDIARLQRWREAAAMRSGARFSDRSIYCTVALAEWLGHPVPPELSAAADDLAASGWFERRAFFVEQLGFIENTAARRISLEEAARFGDFHRAVYARYGFDLVSLAPSALPDRAAALLAAC